MLLVLVEQFHIIHAGKGISGKEDREYRQLSKNKDPDCEIARWISVRITERRRGGLLGH